MKMRSNSARLGASFLLAALLTLSAAAQEVEPTRRALESTRALIEESSSAKQVYQSKQPKSLLMRDEARTWLKQAEAALANGQLADTHKYLTEAKRAMVMAVRLASPAQMDGEKAVRDYEMRLASVKVLRDALQRLGGAKNTATVRETDVYLASASTYASERSFDLALTEINRAYGVIKASNVEQRDHTEQLVSKHFASKEDEYRYEIGRNDEYQQLSDAVLKNLAAGVIPTYRPVLAKALLIRQEAQGQADKGDFSLAVTSMETSTAEYKKIIRAGGIPVP